MVQAGYWPVAGRDQSLLGNPWGSGLSGLHLAILGNYTHTHTHARLYIYVCYLSFVPHCVIFSNIFELIVSVEPLNLDPSFTLDSSETHKVYSLLVSGHHQ